jgi:amino acid adenylation domain-containing protein
MSYHKQDSPRLSKLKTPLRHRPAGRKAAVPVFSCLEELLRHYGRTAPGRNAILVPGRAPITYAALRGRVREAVLGLRRLGIGRRDRVAVVLPNGAETPVAIIAVATAAACVPMNPSFTADEWRRYLGELQAAALLTRADMDSPSRGVAHDLGIPVIDLSPRPEDGPGAFALLGSGTGRAAASEPLPGAEDDAFVLLTSGTGARPKMVPLTHASVCRSAYNAGAVLELGPRDRLLNVLPLHHAHGLISGLLTALAAGSTVVSAPGFDPDAFFGWLTEFRATWYTAVPTVHRALLSAADRHKHRLRRCFLRVIRSASASLPGSLLGALESLFGVPVIETYGMTEAASQIAANPLGRRKPASVGLPAGAEIAIMDKEGRTLAAGERGEIVLRGPTITRGYDNDPAATEAAFRDGWFRTGDLGYLDRDGYLFIVGRLKEVIKRGGQQVAPAEVEEALLAHPGVLEAVAFSIPHPRLGEDVAAVVVLRRGPKVSVQKLRSFVGERLASFKVPGLIRVVTAIPRSRNGKISRAGLAAALAMTPPEARAEGGPAPVAPRSDLERRLAELWAALLDFRQIGIHDDVLALGADSLTVMQMLSRLKAGFGVDFSFKDIFDAPTVAALAARIESSEAEPAASVGFGHTPDASSGCLSFQQQRIHVLSGLDATGYNYHVVEVVRLRGPLHVDALAASIAAVAERHEVLRSTFLERQGEPVQAVGKDRPALECLDLGPCVKRGRAAAIRRYARQFARQPFDIARRPPFRAQLLRLDGEDHALVVALHHIITDGWSQRLFWEELEALYAANLDGLPVSLPPLPIPYRSFAQWQRAWLQTPAAAEQLSYWRARLEGVTELPLRTDRARPDRWTGRGARHPLKLSRTLSRRIKSLGRAHGATLFMTLLAAFQCLLHRYTESEDVAVGSLIANRNHVAIERLMGMFANTIVLRTDLSGDPPFSEVLQRVRKVTLDAYRNQDLPIEEILQALQVPRGLDRNALFQVMFLLQNAPSRAPALKGLSARFVDVDPGIARFDLLLELADADNRLSGWIEYSTNLFEGATIARMAAHLHKLLEAIVANPEDRISALDLLPAAERRLVLVDWNDTRTRYGVRAFSERFARQAERTPGAIAVSTGELRLDYRELAQRSSAIAGRLALEGAGPDHVVAVLAGRRTELPAGLIALQRIGAAFLPLDPALPAARLTRILRHSGAKLVLTDRECAAGLREALAGIPRRDRPRILDLEELARGVPRDDARATRSRPSSLAYVIYTSGSTGAPKGAMVEQRGMWNHLLFTIANLGLSASDVLAHTAPQSYVISVWQFLAPLLVGARVHICTEEQRRDPALLMQELDRHGVTVLQVVPALLRGILQRLPDEPTLRALSRLRWLVSTGEPLTPDLCRDWFRHFPDVPVMNTYGPTECADDVAAHRLTASPPSPAAVPIGRAIANTQLYVLDARLRPVPIGIRGELWVGGVAVGRGYLNDPEQTRRCFLRDPFSNRRGARLYRTGDLARWRADGTLECLGRIDHQVKIRGHRIELGEIEQVVLQHSGIRSAAVLAREDPGGERRLFAYLVAADGWAPEVGELRDFLRARLPEYMVPAGFFFLGCLPLSAHGKVDRAALMALREGLAVAGRKFVAPRDPTENVLAKIWSDVLDLGQIGVSDNFFDLGGHSLLAGRVLARVATACGVSLPIRALFEAPTVEALARRIEDGRAAPANELMPEIADRGGDGPRPTSIVQEHVLHSERGLPGLPQFNLPFAYRLRGRLNVPALEQSLACVTRRHESLRTSFAWADGRSVAVVSPAAAIDPPLVIEDLSVGTRAAKSRARALLLKKAALKAEEEAWTPFDPARPPLWRIRLLRLGPDDHILLLTLHHIIVDGWSIGIFFEEVSKLYSDLAAGRQAALPEPELQFSDLARWQGRWCSSDSAARQFAYWKRHLRAASPLFPANGRAGRALLGSSVAHAPIHLPDALLQRLGAVGRRQGGTLFMTLLAGFKTMLLARTGRNDICIATAMANRSQQKTERVIGPLENTALIRTRMEAELPFREALSRVRDAVLDAHARQELPFDILAARLAEEEGLDPTPLLQVVFVLQNALTRRLSLPDIGVQSFGKVYRQGQPVLPIDRSWLTVMLKDTPSGITGSCSYKSDLFGSGDLRHWLADYKSILVKAAADPETPLGRLAAR